MTDEKGSRSNSVYERIVVAAREAKRLNSRHLTTRVTPRRKVTSEAIERVRSGEVDYDYAERAVDETPAAATPDEEEAGEEWTR